MLIIPIAGDTIKNANGMPYTVLSYLNYDSRGPAVIAESYSGGPQETIYFQDISELNDIPVKMIKNQDGYKVLETDGYISRKYQLPQVGDKISTNKDGDDLEYFVSRIKLHVINAFTKGLIFDVYLEHKEMSIEVGIADITNIEHQIFERDKFLEFYSDYAEKGVA